MTAFTRSLKVETKFNTPVKLLRQQFRCKRRESEPILKQILSTNSNQIMRFKTYMSPFKTDNKKVRLACISCMKNKVERWRTVHDYSPFEKMYTEINSNCEEDGNPQIKFRVYNSLKKVKILDSKKIYTPRQFINKCEKSENQFKTNAVHILDKLKVKFTKEWKQQMPSTHKLKDRVLKIIAKLKQLHLEADDVGDQNIISIKPYQKQNSKAFILACKEDRKEEAMELLKANKYLVYDFDFTKKTALHWATIKMNYYMMDMLIRCHSDIDAQDAHSKTPLHYASLNNDSIACKILLSNNADPFIHCFLDLSPSDYTSSSEIVELFKNVRKIIVLSNWLKHSEKEALLSKKLKEINNTGYGKFQ